MTQSWLIGAMENYRDAVERGQRRLLEAQHDACVTWWSAFSPTYPLSQRDMERRLDDSLLVGPTWSRHRPTPSATGCC